MAWLRERLSRHVGHGVRFFGAKTRAGDLRGLFALLVVRGLKAGATAELTHIGTVRSQRGSGVGTRLLEMAVDRAQQEGAHTLFVHTYAGSTRTIAFYGRSRVHPVAVIPDTNGPDDDGTIVMRRRLA